MATIHFILQGNGGVGKSMVAVMLCQALRHFGKEVIAFDTDPVNATLAGFKEFNVTSLDVMQDGNINPRKFDQLLEALVTAPDDSHVVVDNGASSFIALGAYLSEADVLSLLAEEGHKVFFHSIVTGGQAIGDTLQGLHRTVVGFPDTPVVVWLNPFFGEISINGQQFEDFTIYKEHGHRFHALIDLPLGNKALIGKDLEELFALKMSFDAGINGSSTPIAVKSRLRRYWSQILTCVEQAGLV